MQPKIKILLAEDEPSLAMIVKESLETRNFEVTPAENGKIALDIFLKNSFDILVLDVMMPLLDGFSVATEVRKNNKNIPIIFLTAKSQVQDVVEGFGVGGNDYLKKPFSTEELIVRINALVNRKTNNLVEKKHQIGNYFFDIQKQTLSINQTIFELTNRESVVLEMLISEKNEVIERTYILNKIWGKDDFFNGRSLDVFITKLRKKLEHEPQIKIINSRGFGYKITY
jgi:DNA-binding response OmpR family regulator